MNKKLELVLWIFGGSAILSFLGYMVWSIVLK